MQSVIANTVFICLAISALLIGFFTLLFSRMKGFLIRDRGSIIYPPKEKADLKPINIYSFKKDGKK